MWSWAPMARAHAEKRAQREQAGSREEKRRGHPKFISQPQTRLMPTTKPCARPVKATSPLRLKSSLRTNVEEVPHMASCRKEKFKIPFRWRPFSRCLPCYRENLKHKRLVCICVLGENISCLYPTDTTVVFSISVYWRSFHQSVPVVRPVVQLPISGPCLTWHWAHQLISCQAVNHSTPESIRDLELALNGCGPLNVSSPDDTPRWWTYPIFITLSKWPGGSTSISRKTHSGWYLISRSPSQ